MQDMNSIEIFCLNPNGVHSFIHIRDLIISNPNCAVCKRIKCFSIFNTKKSIYKVNEKHFYI